LGNLSSDWLQTSIDVIWQPLGAETAVTRSLLHPENERQRSVNSSSCSIFDNQGIALIFAFRKELLTALMGKYTMYQR